MEKVRDPAANAVADLHEHGGKLRDDLAEHGQRVGRRLRDARKQASRTARQVGDEISHGYDIARDYTSRGARDAWSAVRRHPTASIAIAVGVGVLIGGLMLSRR
jgi:ElaB/YqjD/DUF883 family membrane-anchored ribosome-binding protein